VLHVLVLYLLPVLQEAHRRIPAPLLTARLAKPQPAVPVPPKVEPPVQADERPRPEPVAKALPRPARAPLPPERILSVAPAPLAAEPAFVVPAQPAAPVAPAASVARVEPPPVPPGAAAAGGPEAGTVAQFRLELMELAYRIRRYPRVAQDNNWEGKVELRIAVGEDGAISSLTMKSSSGRVVLDDEAQSMIRIAKSKVAIPAALRGKAFVIEIPVVFVLEKK
jgi:TonB family protein